MDAMKISVVDDARFAECFRPDRTEICPSNGSANTFSVHAVSKPGYPIEVLNVERQEMRYKCWCRRGLSLFVQATATKGRVGNRHATIDSSTFQSHSWPLWDDFAPDKIALVHVMNRAFGEKLES